MSRPASRLQHEPEARTAEAKVRAWRRSARVAACGGL